MGGTLSAKAVEPYSAIMVADEAPTFAENYKVCKADTPQEKTSYGNAQGVRILITECTEHDFGYSDSETSGMHKVACKLCSVFREEAHDFSFGSEPSDQMKHYLTCACGAKSVTAEYHNFVCTPNNDSLTHGTACSVCGYEKADSSSEEHDFTSDKTLCSKCGFKRGVSIRFGDTLINREKFADVLDLAMGGSGSSTDGIITVYGGEECFPGTQITVKWGKFTIDLNGAELAFPGITLFDINRNANETPTAITGPVYKVNDNTPQTLHTSGRVIGTVGTMKYTTGNPESADTVWSDTPLTSRDAGEFVVYYKVFGDSNHLDSAYGTISCRIAKYKLAYEIVCLPKVYDGTKNGDPKNIASITFFGAEDKTKVVLTEKDYTVESIVYESENVGGNLGTIPVSATASVKLNDTNTASNYELAEDQSSASGCITPARIEGIDFHGYTFKVLYINTYAKTIKDPLDVYSKGSYIYAVLI